MFQFIIRRTVGALVTLILIGAATFFLFVAAPSDYASLACGKDCSPARLEDIRQALGLNLPIHQQFWDFMSGIVMGRDFPTGHCSAPCLGQSFYSGDMVWSTIMDRFPTTLTLTVGGAVVFVIVGIGAGMIAAYRRGTMVDKVATSVSMVLSSFQIYVLGPLVLLIFVYSTGWMDNPAYHPITDDPWKWFTGLLLPVLVMSTIFTAQYTRMARSSMIEQLAEEHVRTARAKGMSNRYVFFRYAWRGSMIPIVTVLGIDISSMLGGAVVTELTFSLQGIGRLAVDGAVHKDLPLTMGVMLFGAFFILIVNILTDIAYAYIDPRVRLS
ncbi:ABC transporter permease [Streptomyces griseorubiginosus]|uniref:ABC transporter permease n=1 Tax=Streptomyces griseorubiginosus TaxID=67304 RepID=A0A101SDF3_9ACTN|nr:ABC transporter permease [Streptomyces griseorubiginosus]AYC38804.1 Glutathione transport system permease protein GsiC [Streptomyces griseorubiginosus]KUM77750.1 ABC transporter permease [Streptomyces griseorubiginosus]KUN71793.1 ABC transporter permease [Streptomyces griseorubiginosus]